MSGWRIDVRSVTVAEEEAKRARAALEAIPGLDFMQSERLFQEGYRTVREVAEAPIEEIAEIDGFSQELAESVSASAKQLVEEASDSVELGEAPEPLEVLSDLDRLMLGNELQDKLVDSGYSTIQSLVSADYEELVERGVVDEQELEEIKEATNTFFRSGSTSRLL